jgi:hypothetical protein
VIPKSTKVTLYCDNRSAIKMADQAKNTHQWFTSSRCWANYDLFCELSYIQLRLPITINFKWVKGHQSRMLGGATWALSTEAKLNEAADKLASAFIVERERHRTPIEAERWSAQRIVVSNSEGTITGDLAKSIRASMHNVALQNHFQDKYKWDATNRPRVDRHGSTKTHTS